MHYINEYIIAYQVFSASIKLYSGVNFTINVTVLLCLHCQKNIFDVFELLYRKMDPHTFLMQKTG